MRSLNASQRCKVQNWMHFHRDIMPGKTASYLCALIESELGFPLSTSSVLTIGQAMGVIKKRVKKPKEIPPLNGAVMAVPELRNDINKLSLAVRELQGRHVQIVSLNDRIEMLEQRLTKQESRLL